MLTSDLINRMSNESRANETGSSDAPARRRRRLVAEEGREKEGQCSSSVREGGGRGRRGRGGRGGREEGGGGGGGGNSDHGGGRNGRMNSPNEVDLDRCLWRGTSHHHHPHHPHLPHPSKEDALSSCSSSSSICRRVKPATVAKILRDAERSYASISSQRRSMKPPARFGLAVRSEFVTSLANDVMSGVNDDVVVGLRSSMTSNPRGGKLFEFTSQRQTEESSGITGIAGRKEGGIEPSRRQKWGTIINRTKVETEEKRKEEAEEQRQMVLSVENIKEESSVSNVHANSKEQLNETDTEKEEAGKEEVKEKEDDDQKKKQWEQKEEQWRRELSSFAIDFLDAVNDIAPEDKASETIIREEQVIGANRSSINKTEPSGTVRVEQQVPRRPQPDAAVDLQKQLSETVSHDRLPKIEVDESDVETRCHEQRVQHDVTVTIGSQIRCTQQIIESFQAEDHDRDERIIIAEQHARETTVTETELFKIASVSATYRIVGQHSPLDSFASRRHFGPLSSTNAAAAAVRSAEPQMSSPSSSNHSYNTTSVAANESTIRRRDSIRVREVTIGDSKLRLVGNCKRTHPQPNRASILRQVAAASSSTSSFPFSTTSRSSTIGSPLMVRRNYSNTVARNFTPPPLVLIQGPFPKDRRTQITHYSKRKPATAATCLAGNSSGRAKLHPNSIITSVKPSRLKYQKTRTFLVNGINSPRGSPRRRSTSSCQSSTPKRTRPTSPECSDGKRPLKELRPKWQQQRQQQHQQRQQQHEQQKQQHEQQKQQRQQQKQQRQQQKQQRQQQKQQRQQQKQQRQQQKQQRQQEKQQQLNRSFFIHNFCSTQTNSDDLQPQQQLQQQQRKAVLLHRTATRTLVARVEER